MPVNYPNYLMVPVRKTTHLEKDPAGLVWLLPCSIVWQLVMALGQGGGLGASKHRLCFSKSCLIILEQSEGCGLLSILASGYQASTDRAESQRSVPHKGFSAGAGNGRVVLALPELLKAQFSWPERMLQLDSQQTCR